MTKPGPSVTSGADTQPGSDSLFPSGFGGGANVRPNSVGTSEIADGSIAAADLNLTSVAGAIATHSNTWTGAQDFTGATVTGVATGLTRTAVKTSAYTAAAGDLIPVDTTAGNVTVTLPTAPADKAKVTVKHIIQGGSNTVTVACGGSDVLNKAGGNTTATLTLVNQGATYEYQASTHIWTVTGGDLPLTGLNGTYAQVIKPEAYGAKGDGKRVNDGAITSGTTTLTCLVSAPFTPGDSGKPILVGGAGSAGAHLAATMTYVDAQTVTLSVAASTTVAGAATRWGSDDTAAIQAAFTAWSAATTLPLRPADLLFSPGKIYFTTTPLLVHNPLNWEGGRVQGYGAQLVYTGFDANAYALTFSTVEDTPTPTNGWRNLSVKGLAFYGGGLRWKGGSSATSTLYGFDCTDLFLEEFIGHGIWIDGSFECILNNCKLVAATSVTAFNCIHIQNSSNSGVVSSVDIVGGSTRRGQYGLYGNGADAKVQGGTYLTALKEGIYLDNCVGDTVNGAHIEACWRGSSQVDGQAGIRMIGHGTMSNIHAVRTSDGMANIARVFSANHVTIIGGHGFGLLRGLYIDGAANSTVVVTGTVDYTLGGGYSTPGSGGKLVKIGGDAAGTKPFTLEGSARLTVSGSQNANPAVGSLLTQLAGLGLITDSTTVGTMPTLDQLTAPATGLVAVAPQVLKNGEASYDPRQAIANCTTASQRLLLSYFTALRTETINNVACVTNATAAGATPTLCRMGVYSVDASDNLTLVASTASDTALFAGANTGYTRALTAPLSKVAGQRYAIGVLVVTGAATPTFCGNTALNGSGQLVAMGSSTPRRAGQVSGQADLPGTVTAGTVTSPGSSIYFELTP